MTCEEFSDRFDVLLNSYGNQAPFGEETSVFDVSVDEYEKSVCLTDAQRELVLAYYNGQNPAGVSFEEKEQIREALDALVKSVKRTTEASTPTDFEKLNVKDKNVALYSLPKDLLFIIFEEVIFSSYISGCEGTHIGIVVPATHDDVWHRINNPFRGPYQDRVLRLNVNDNLVELISDHPIGSYILRYLEQPKPIILTDLPDGLSIDGKDEKTECALPEILHEAILEAAVRLALQRKSIGRVQPKANSKRNNLTE